MVASNFVFFFQNPCDIICHGQGFIKMFVRIGIYSEVLSIIHGIIQMHSVLTEYICSLKYTYLPARDPPAAKFKASDYVQEDVFSCKGIEMFFVFHQLCVSLIMIVFSQNQ